jgi:hypothetical protein
VIGRHGRREPNGKGLRNDAAPDRLHKDAFKGKIIHAACVHRSDPFTDTNVCANLFLCNFVYLLLANNRRYQMNS